MMVGKMAKAKTKPTLPSGRPKARIQMTRPGIGVMEQFVDLVPGCLHDFSAPIELQNHEAKKQLQAHAPGHDFPLDSFAVGGEGVTAARMARMPKDL